MGTCGAWQAPKPARHRHALHPESQGRPCWIPPHPCTAAGGRPCPSAFGWWCPHGASQSPKIPAVPSKAVLTQACGFNPQPREQELKVPTGRATPKNRAVAGAKKQGEGRQVPKRERASLCLQHPPPPEPLAGSRR